MAVLNVFPVVIVSVRNMELVACFTFVISICKILLAISIAKNKQLESIILDDSPKILASIILLDAMLGMFCSLYIINFSL